MRELPPAPPAATRPAADADGLAFPGFAASRVGLVALGAPSYEQWRQAGAGLRQAEGAIHWWIGDWLNHGERAYGEKYAEAVEEMGYDYQTLRDDAWVAGAVQLSRRRDNLSWSHHQEVAALPEADQDELLDQAEREGLTRNQLRQRVRQRRQERAALEAPPLPPGKYRCIVVDPPWPVEKRAREARPRQGPHLDFPVMALADLEALVGGKLRAHAADGCHVYLWVTQKYLPAGLRLFEAWDVSYECALTWVKPTGMTPFTWMYNTEHVLFGRIGALPLETLGLKLAFAAPAARHSAKPGVFYERVRAASPGPRLSLFEREPRDGFTVWGDEVGGGPPSRDKEGL